MFSADESIFKDSFALIHPGLEQLVGVVREQLVPHEVKASLSQVSGCEYVMSVLVRSESLFDLFVHVNHCFRELLRKIPSLIILLESLQDCFQVVFIDNVERVLIGILHIEEPDNGSEARVELVASHCTGRVHGSHYLDSF